MVVLVKRKTILLIASERSLYAISCVLTERGAHSTRMRVVALNFSKKLQAVYESIESQLLVLKLQPCLLPHCTVHSRNITLVTHVFLNRLQTTISHLNSLHLRATRLC